MEQETGKSGTQNPHLLQVLLHHYVAKKKKGIKWDTLGEGKVTPINELMRVEPTWAEHLFQSVAVINTDQKQLGERVYLTDS